MKRILLAAVVAASALFTGCQPAKTGGNTEALGSTGVNAAVETGMTAEIQTPAETAPQTAAYPAGTELTIATFLQDSYLDYVAQEFMKKHPEVKVTVNLYSSETERDLTKYQQTLNTAMMSGGGEDIIDVSKLNRARLADRDMLLDLNEGLELDNERYYMNILDGYLYKGKRVTLPLNFVMQGFKFAGESPAGKAPAGEPPAANETAAELTLDSLQALADTYPGTALFSGGGSGMNAENLAIEIFNRNKAAFINLEDKTVNLDDGQFEAILNQVKALTDTVGLENARLDITAEGQRYLLNQYMIYTPDMTSDGLIDYTGVIPLVYNGAQTYSNVGYMPAINANTQNKALAFEFIQFMISDEMMVSPEQLFCTVNRNAVAQKAMLGYESSVAGGYAPEGFTEANLKQNLILFDEMAAKATVPEDTDAAAREFLYEDLTEFFQGNISAGETCGRLQSKLIMYLNE